MGIFVCNEGRFRRMLKGAAASVAVVCMIGLSGLPAYAASATDLPTGSAGATAGSAPFVDGVVPAITDPFDGVVFHDVPSISGTGEPGSTASIADGNGTLVCTSPIDEWGYFACTATELLPAGANELTVTATAPDGATTVGNTVQVTAEYFPNISDPVVGQLISNIPAFSGRALPGVQVQMVTADGTAVCTTVSDDWGLFQCLTSVPFPAGPLTLAPSMATAEGGVVRGDATTWTVIANPVITSPAHGSITGDRPVFSGTGYPGADISIAGGRSGLPMCTTKVEADGTFSCLMDRPLMVGSLEVFPSVSANGVGSVAGKMITFAVEVSPTILRPAQGNVVPEFPVVEGTAGARSNVAIEDEHGTTICSTVADEMGIFGCAVLDAALTPGTHTLTPVQTSFAGIVVRGASVSVTVPGSVPEVTPSASPSPSATPTTPPATVAPTSPAVTKPTAAPNQGTARVLAATGASSTAQVAVVGGLLLLLGAASLLPRFRRRTHG